MGAGQWGQWWSWELEWNSEDSAEVQISRLASDSVSSAGSVLHEDEQ